MVKRPKTISREDYQHKLENLHEEKTWCGYLFAVISVNCRGIRLALHGAPKTELGPVAEVAR